MIAIMVQRQSCNQRIRWASTISERGASMRLELKRVEPMRAANIGALVYGIVMAVFALVFLPFLLLGFALHPPVETPG